MPTGYTAAVQSGKVTKFEDFAMQCARAFGALVTMRDDAHDAEIPDCFEPSTDYHDRALREAHETLQKVEGMTDRECARRAKEDYERASEQWAGREEKRATERARYEAMLERVRLWNPPTPEHAGLRRFMETQLMESIEFDCEMGSDDHPSLQTGHEWRMAEIAGAEWAIAYHSRERAKEIERTNERNEWLSRLRSSLGLGTKCNTPAKGGGS